MPTKEMYWTTTLEALTCGSCGIPFAMPQDMHTKAQKSGDWFWCPNGHQIHYSQTENQRLTRDLEAAERRAMNERERAEAVERRLIAARGQQTKLKNRIANGVCPCCNRSFVNLQRHIAGQHPTFTETKPA